MAFIKRKAIRECDAFTSLRGCIHSEELEEFEGHLLLLSHKCSCQQVLPPEEQFPAAPLGKQ